MNLSGFYFDVPYSVLLRCKRTLQQQGIITLGTIMNNYRNNKVIFFYSCQDLFDQNVLLTLHYVYGAGVKL